MVASGLAIIQINLHHIKSGSAVWQRTSTISCVVSRIPTDDVRTQQTIYSLFTWILDIINTGTTPKFRNLVREEVIAIAFCTQSIREKDKKWRALNEPITVVDWICHMLCNRNITITTGNITLRGIVDSGCPQGGVRSPLLLSLVVDELLHLSTDQGCHPIGYTDDILVIVRGMHLDTLIGVMQQMLKVVDTWCRTTGLLVNSDKTDVVIFTRWYK